MDIRSNMWFVMESLRSIHCAKKILSLIGIPAFLDAQDFECPSSSGFFPDSIQCDKYYRCIDGVAKEHLCADGLVFDENIKRLNKCDQPFNVDCGDRTELRKSFDI